MFKKIFIKEHSKSYKKNIIILIILIIFLCIVGDFLSTHTLTKATLKLNQNSIPSFLKEYEFKYNLLITIKKISFYTTIVISSIVLIYTVLRAILSETKFNIRVQEFIKNILLVVLILSFSVVLNYVTEIIIGINVIHCWWCNPEVIINR